jgi:Tfp pilus assembly PilM family ATPase
VRSGLKLWPGFPFRRITRAWGVALDERGVTLVCLGRTTGDAVRVLHTLHLLAPAWAQAPDSHHDWLVDALREASAQEVRRHRRLVLALPMERCHSGVLELPVALDLEALQAEVQIEAAQSLGVSTQDVSFDFHMEAETLAETRRVHWRACLRSEVQAWQRHTQAAGWRLPAIEDQAQAARRGAQLVRGGVHQLLTQAHRDWQFSDPVQGDGAANALPDEALTLLRGISAWAWLCACGAALRALS